MTMLSGDYNMIRLTGPLVTAAAWPIGALWLANREGPGS